MKSQTATKNLLMSVLLVGSMAGPAAHACSDDAAAILLCFTVGFFYPECNDAKMELVKRALTPFESAIPGFDECSVDDPNAPAGLEYPDVKIIRNPAAYVPDAGDEETPPENPSPAELNTAGKVFRVSDDQVFVDDTRCLDSRWHSRTRRVYDNGHGELHACRRGAARVSILSVLRYCPVAFNGRSDSDRSSNRGVVSGN